MFLWDFVFPRRCLSCGRLGAYICPRCIETLKSVSVQRCLYCNRPSLQGLTHPGCRRRDGVDGSASLYYYNNTLKKIIAGIKYRLIKDALPDLYYVIYREAKPLVRLYRDLGGPVLQPVPQSKGRKKERGFNQAHTVAVMFSRLLSLRMVSVIKKPRETAPQATLPDRSMRRGNLTGAFSVMGTIPPPPRIVLVDDVVTTGETVKEAAKTLKKNGVEKVYVLSVAKG